MPGEGGRESGRRLSRRPGAAWLGLLGQKGQGLLLAGLVPTVRRMRSGCSGISGGALSEEQACGKGVEVSQPCLPQAPQDGTPMSPVPTLQVRLRSRAYERRPGSLQPNGCPSSGPEGPQSSGRCEELSESCSPRVFPNPVGGGGWSHPRPHSSTRWLQLQALPDPHRWGADCPEPGETAYAGGLHLSNGSRQLQGSLCPWAPRPVHPCVGGPRVGAMSQVERRPKARLAVESSFNEPAPAREAWVCLTSDLLD